MKLRLEWQNHQADVNLHLTADMYVLHIHGAYEDILTYCSFQREQSDCYLEADR